MIGYCNNCGAQVQDNFMVCHRCGAPISQQTVQQQYSQYPQSQKQYPDYTNLPSNYPYQQEPYYQRSSNNFSLLKITSIFFAVIVIVILFISLLGPWYNMSMRYDGGSLSQDSTMDFYLDKMTSSSNFDGKHTSETKTYKDIKDEIKNVNSSYAPGYLYDYYDGMSKIGSITIFLIIITIIITILIILLIAVSFINKNSIIRHLCGILCIITFVLILFTVFNFMFSWTDAQQKPFSMLTDSTLSSEEIGFWYSKELSGISFRLGPGYAWYIMIIAGIFILLSGIFLFIKPKNQDIPRYQYNY